MRRKDCPRCLRPAATSCLCPHLAPIETAVEVVFLQHIRESKRRIGTAWLAHQALPGSTFLVDLDFLERPELDELLDRCEGRAHLLFPGLDAIDLSDWSGSAPPTLVVPDGTWWQARKMVRNHPRLSTLPRATFGSPPPSRFPLRRPPRPGLRSTLESVVEALVALEGRPGRFEPLLGALDAIVAERDRRRIDNPDGPRRRQRPR